MKNKLILVALPIIMLVAFFSFKHSESVMLTIKDKAKIVYRWGEIIRYGEDGFVREKLSKQRVTHSSESTARTIETAWLPLIIKTKILSSESGFAKGAGSFAIAKNKLLIMDFHGSIFALEADKIVRLDIPNIPNNARNYLLRSKNLNFNNDTLRSHSITFDPATFTLYASFEKYVSPSVNVLSVSRLKLREKDLSAVGQWETIFESEATDPQKNLGIAGGGKLLLANGILYIAVGDYGMYISSQSNAKHAAQNLGNKFGKIHGYDSKDRKISLISYGHRNTQGMVFTEEGSLLNVEQGPQGGDEINEIERGANYGWPIATYGTNYGAYKWEYTNDKLAQDAKKPVFAFLPSVATSSIIQIKKFNERWNGDLLIGSLKAQSLYRLRYQDRRVIFNEPIYIGKRIRDLIEFDEKLYVLTDDGFLCEISVQQDNLKQNLRDVDVTPHPALSKCMACHHYNDTNASHFAPTFKGLASRKIGSDNFDNYSQSLKGSTEKWSVDRLASFILDPQSVFSGTVMPRQDVSKDEAISIARMLLKEGR